MLQPWLALTQQPKPMAYFLQAELILFWGQEDILIST